MNNRGEEKEFKTKWSFWHFRMDSTKSYKDCLTFMGSVGSFSEFWRFSDKIKFCDLVFIL